MSEANVEPIGVATPPRTRWMKGVGNSQDHKHYRQPLEPRAYRRGCGFWGSASGFVEKVYIECS